MLMTKRDKVGKSPSSYSVPADVPAQLHALGSEVSRLEESARISSQGHFESAKFWHRCHLVLGVHASLFGLFSGGAALTDMLPPTLVGVGALVGAGLAGTATVLGSERRGARAKTCANTFHDVQDDARRLLLVDLKHMQQQEASSALRTLAERYSETRHAADALARRFYVRAKRNISEGGQTFSVDTESATVPRNNSTQDPTPKDY